MTRRRGVRLGASWAEDALPPHLYIGAMFDAEPIAPEVLALAAEVVLTLAAVGRPAVTIKRSGAAQLFDYQRQQPGIAAAIDAEADR